MVSNKLVLTASMSKRKNCPSTSCTWRNFFDLPISSKCHNWLLIQKRRLWRICSLQTVVNTTIWHVCTSFLVYGGRF